MKMKKIFGTLLYVLVTILTLVFITIGSTTILADEQSSLLEIVNDEVFLPVGGVNPTKEIRFDKTKLFPTPVAVVARIRSPLQRTLVQAQIPGYTRYGYEWISNPENTGNDSQTLAAIYEALVSYADLAYMFNGEYTYDDFYDSYHIGGLQLSELGLAADDLGEDGPISQKTLSLIRLTFAAFMCDNPQYYMLNGSYGITFSYAGGSPTLIIESIYPLMDSNYKSYDDRIRINGIIESKFKEYNMLAGTVSTDYDKARIVHDKILAERDYSYHNGAPDNSSSAHNILGVLDLSERGPVCESYTEAYAYILNRLGIDTITIFGEAQGGGNGSGGHAWNLVKIDDKYYYVDSTWNDFETVGRVEGTYNDEGNLKNALYHRYFMVGTENTDFTDKHIAATPTGDNGYYLFGLPPNISKSDYDTMNGSSYKWLMDNGLNNLDYTYGPDYNYYIGYTDKVGYPSEYPDALFVNKDGWRWNGWSSHDFGEYTVTETAKDISVEGNLWHWTFDRSMPWYNNQFSNPVKLIQDTDYEIVVEKPYHEGLNRAYIYGMGAYRGIDFAIINLSFADASTEISNLTVKGTAGTALADNLTATITLTNASVIRGGLNDENVTNWFNNMPEGVTATANAESLSKTVTVTFSGTPTESSKEAFNISIPETAQTSGVVLNIDVNPNAKFEIIEPKLDAPHLTLNELNSLLSWSKVNNADKYELTFDDGINVPVKIELSADENSIQLPLSFMIPTVTYEITAKAIPTLSDYLASDTSNILTYTILQETLPTPVLSKVSDSKVTWISIANAGSYEVVLINEENPDTDVIVFVTDSTEIDLSEMSELKPNTNYAVKVKALPADTLKYVESPYSNIITLFNEVITHAEKPNIISQPIDVSVTQGKPASVSITASVSKGELSYQWYSNTNQTNTGGTAIVSATTSTYDPPTNTTGIYYYYCIITNTDNSATGNKTAEAISNVCMVIINQPPNDFEIILQSNELIKQNNTIDGRITINVSNNTKAEKNADIILAIYDNNDMLVYVDFYENVVLNISNNSILFSGINIKNAISSKYTVRAFTWESLMNQMPLSEFLEFEL